MRVGVAREVGEHEDELEAFRERLVGEGEGDLLIILLLEACNVVE